MAIGVLSSGPSARPSRANGAPLFNSGAMSLITVKTQAVCVIRRRAALAIDQWHLISGRAREEIPKGHLARWSQVRARLLANRASERVQTLRRICMMNNRHQKFIGLYARCAPCPCLQLLPGFNSLCRARLSLPGLALRPDEFFISAHTRTRVDIGRRRALQEFYITTGAPPARC
jgi:hypothetical protein